MSDEYQNEEWRPVPGNPAYHVSNLGRVKSFRRNKEGTIMKPSVNPWWGYLTVSIAFEGKPPCQVGIHRLVAAAFIGARPDKYHTHHIDHNKANNRVENLTYVTHHENALAYAVVRREKKRLEKMCQKEKRRLYDFISHLNEDEQKRLRRRINAQ